MQKEPSKKTAYAVQPRRLDVVRLVQVTDSHIFADPEKCLLGLNTRESFSAVCDRLVKEEWRPDALLATGDLSQDASPESYQYLANYFVSMGTPTFWLAGNHDDPLLMEKYLDNAKVQRKRQILIGDWQILMLDSSVRGRVSGELSNEQLRFLEQSLRQHPDKYCLVCLHHQPVEIGSEWLDKLGLLNGTEFRRVLKKHRQVKGVIWGHVHQVFEQESDGILWMASPSSCVQFKPASKNFSAGTEAPGYRYLSLYSDGRIDSVVHRIDSVEFSVDYSIKGY